ncbi:MAG: XRE family transcriptional regulator [Candidatus Babeliales bacterium]|jgi:SOS-response transcriptional repressor LexA
MVTTKLRVKELLRERRWTTKVLAEKTGMSESYLTHIKNGTRRWNEDALKKLALAFEITPGDLLVASASSINTGACAAQVLPEFLAEQFTDENYKHLQLRIVPLVGQIPSQPSEYNNRMMQIATGYKDQFVPVFGCEDNAMFCLNVEDSAMAPNIIKGDQLIIAPSVWTKSGDIVAVEYGNEVAVRMIAQVNFMEEFVVLESVNHKKAPIALVKGKDSFRIIGKVIYKIQKFA